MKRLLSILLATVVLVAFGASGVQAKPQKDTFKLPQGAKLLPDGSYSLGKKTDPTSGKEVEGVAFLHPKKQAAKQLAARPGGGTACYAFITSGLKWKTNEPWQLDAANSHGLDSAYLLSNTVTNVAKWENASGA